MKFQKHLSLWDWQSSGVSARNKFRRSMAPNSPWKYPCAIPPSLCFVILYVTIWCKDNKLIIYLSILFHLSSHFLLQRFSRCFQHVILKPWSKLKSNLAGHQVWNVAISKVFYRTRGKCQACTSLAWQKSVASRSITWSQQYFRWI